MKRIMVIGASIGQVPMIRKAKELGHYVAVLDYDSKAIGIQYADEFINASTIDEDAVVSAAVRFKPDGVVTMQTDMPMRSIAKVNEILGLCGIDYDTAVRATDKIEMIKCFKSNKIESPWYLSVDDDLEDKKNLITYPCIIKPADSSGSRGVNYVDDPSLLPIAYSDSKEKSKAGKVIIEEYMDGPEVSVETISWEGQVYVIAVTDKTTTGFPHFVEIGHSEPSTLENDKVLQIIDLTKRAVKAIGIENGQAHVEIIYTESGPKVVELGARLGGDFIASNLVPLSTGVDMLEATIRIACNEKPDIISTKKRGSAIKFIETRKGRLESIEGVEQAKRIEGIKEIGLLHNIGDYLESPSSSWDRICYVISQANTPYEAKNICDKAIQLIKVKIHDI